jgi:hypothetical protein
MANTPLLAATQSARVSTGISIPAQLANLKVPTTRAEMLAGTHDDKIETMLEDGYQLHRFDVICTNENYFHVGNNRFRLLVEMRVERYSAAKTRSEKTSIVKEIIDAVRCSGGRFIRRNTSYRVLDSNLTDKESAGVVYYDIGYKKTIDKIGHALRSAMKARELNNRRRSFVASGPDSKNMEAATTEEMSSALTCEQT